MKKIFILPLLLLCCVAAKGESIADNLNYAVRLGYSIGGTSPIGMPATIRSLDSYKLQANLQLGFDVQKDIWGQWGLLVGIHLEKKGMETDATVKNYHMEMIKGGESLEGVFTGHNVVQVDMQMVTIPIMATYAFSDKLRLKFGPYVSFLTTHKFEGYVYDGYLRQDNPTGPRIDIGNEADTRGTFDFSGNMRHVHYGLDFGADWFIYDRWGVYADIAWGLNGIHHSSFKTIEQTLYPIYGTIGVAYRLK